MVKSPCLQLASLCVVNNTASEHPDPSLGRGLIEPIDSKDEMVWGEDLAARESLGRSPKAKAQTSRAYATFQIWVC